MTGSPRRNDKLCILMVEDDDADAYLIKRALSDIPRVAEVVRARNGAEAVHLLETGAVAPDLAFVDLQMPMMNGFELLLAFVDKGLANIPVVVLTSSSSPHDSARSRVRGAVRVVTKPENVAELYAVLETTVDVLTRPQSFSEDANLGRGHFFLPTAPAEAPRPSLRRVQPPAAPAAAPAFGRRDPGGRS